MPGGIMPYLMEKGPYFSVVEDLLSTHQGRVDMLQALRQGRSIAELVGLDSPGLSQPNGGDGRTPAQRMQHLEDDWFGRSDPAGKLTTGWWEGWKGRPEDILREAIIRALEVSFGIEHDAPPPATSTGALCSIDVYWICQGPWFQCWVTWNKTSTGHVALIITTPPPSEHPLKSPLLRVGSKAERPEYASDPPTTTPRGGDGRPQPNGKHGMWVVGHQDYVKQLVLTVSETPRGRAVTGQTIRWVPTPDESVVTVSPSESEGGVLADGRKF
jgi:hypothetical protein